MPDLTNSSDLLAAVTQVIMAALGALARVLNKRDGLTLTHTLSELFVAAFTGLMLYWLSTSLEFAGPWVFALSGIAGWLGPATLDWITDLVAKKAGIQLPEKPSKPPGSDGTGADA